MKSRLLTAAALAFTSSIVGAAPVLAPPQPLAADVQAYVKMPAGRIAPPSICL